MQIVEINEQNSENQENELIVGIDFGTTNSLIAYSKNHKPRVIKPIISSIVTYNDKLKNFEIGKHRDFNSISSIKRLLAKTYNEITTSESLNKLVANLSFEDADQPKIIFNKKSYYLSEIAAKIFTQLKFNAEDELGKKINKAVICTPAYFDDASRGAILLAAKIAGFEVLRIIAEPTAAAYAYGFDKKPNGSYMVYDLGGGTFDVSILSMQTGILQVLATGGDNMLGGDDIDYLLSKYLADNFQIKNDHDLRLESKKLKEQLSKDDLVTSKYFINEKHLSITRNFLEELMTPLIDKTINIAKETLFDADIEIDGIILVGGATRTPLITKKLTEIFGVKVFSDIDPDKAVAIGAALQAENLSSSADNNSVLIDVLPLSLGLELYGGITEKIIMRNSSIPISVTKNFTTHIDNQTGMQFHVVQGEREMMKDCRSLGYFELKNIPPMKAGKAKIEVTFTVDIDGILSVTAHELTNQIIQNIDIKPSYGLDDEKINEILENAFKNAELDYKNRLLVETRFEAENIINGINQAIKETPDILNKKEKAEIFANIDALNNAINLSDREKMLAIIEKLNQSASSFIQNHLNKGAKLILQGKNIDEI